MVARAREDRLVVQELPDEVLVYDLDRHKAHCLNRTAALVWRHCDGRTTAAEMACLLEKELKFPVDEAVVWLALGRLGRAHLLEERVRPPAGAAGLSRREVVRRLALAGGLLVLLPLVSSIVAPTAAHAASCISNAACEALNKPCPGTPVCEYPGQCCLCCRPGKQCNNDPC